MHICSGCDNECEIGEQYCLDCLREIAQDDWEEAQAYYHPPCEHVWLVYPGEKVIFCKYCGLIRED